MAGDHHRERTAPLLTTVFDPLHVAIRTSAVPAVNEEPYNNIVNVDERQYACKIVGTLRIPFLITADTDGKISAIKIIFIENIYFWNDNSELIVLV